jgi:16S rRNA (adenine1518-N6/adenine1519-N6)-dimethyltransferase
VEGSGDRNFAVLQAAAGTLKSSLFCYTALGMTRQPMGQHFLADLGWRQRILATLPSNAEDVWVEIGAGHGEMTRLLGPRCRRLIAIEGDPALAAALGEQVHNDPSTWRGVEVLGADVLACELSALGDGAGRFRVCGNLPYYITSPILHRLFACAERIDSIHIVIQLEVAERIVAHPGCRDYGYLSTICQFYTKPEIALKIPPGAFHPPPKVHSALMRMTLPGERGLLGIPIDQETDFLEFVQRCFGQKRKTVRNNLKSETPDQKIHQALVASGIRPDARAEQLTLAQFAALFANLQ